MKPKVYLETTIPSYLTAWPSSNVVRLAHQQITKKWWQTHREAFELFVSQSVLGECGAGDSLAAAERLEILKDLPILLQTDEAVLLSEVLLRGCQTTG